MTIFCMHLGCYKLCSQHTQSSVWQISICGIFIFLFSSMCFSRNFSLNFLSWLNGFFSKSLMWFPSIWFFSCYFFSYQLWFWFHRTQRIHSIWYQFFIFLRLFNGPGFDPPWCMFNQHLKRTYILVLLGGDSYKYQFDPISWWWW